MKLVPDYTHMDPPTGEALRPQEGLRIVLWIVLAVVLLGGCMLSLWAAGQGM